MNQTLDFTGNTPGILNNSKNLVNNVIQQYIVRPTSGDVSGFVFDVIGDEEISLDSEITDHYLEDNTSIQDHIALRPEKFSVKGYVGELSDILAKQSVSVLSQIQTLGSLGGLNPSFTAQAQQTYNRISSVTSQATQVVNQAQNFFNLFNQSNTTSNKQQKGFKYFYNMWLSRTLCTVETPFAIFPNPNDKTQAGMAIESVRAIQREDTNEIADFIVTFKMIRKVPTKISIAGVNIASFASVINAISIGRASDNVGFSSPINLGTITGSYSTVDLNDVGSFKK